MTVSKDAFGQSWQGKNKWYVPPPRLIAKCLKKKRERGISTLLAAKWISAPFWSSICEKPDKFRNFVIDYRNLPQNGTIHTGKGNNGIF